MTKYLVWDRADEGDDAEPCTSALGYHIKASSPQDAAETYAARDGDNHRPEHVWSLVVIDTATGERFAFYVEAEVHFNFRCGDRLLEIDP